jgi:branched-chain amino acid transport system ATP-binding protein
MLEATGVSKSFGALRVLSEVSLKVSAGTIHGLIGPNGAGKTTLLDLICGKTRASSGRIRFMGKEVTRMPEHEIVREGLVMVAEGRQLFPQMTVRENLELGGWLVPRARGRLVTRARGR